MSTDCPVHEAALEALRQNSPSPLLTRLGPQPATAEFASCSLCQDALAAYSVHRQQGGQPGQQWANFFDRHSGVLS